MTPAQLKVLLQVGVGLILAPALCAAGFACAWYWQENSYTRQLAEQSSGYQADLLSITNAGAAQNRKALQQQAAEARAAAIDQRYIKEKAHDIAENEKLRRAVADGTRRLRIAGACSANSDGSGNLSGPAGVAGLGDAGTVELLELLDELFLISGQESSPTVKP